MTVTLDLTPFVQLSDAQFYELCRRHPELKLERTARGEIVIMPPAGGDSGNRNGRLTQRLFNWTDQDASGVAFDSSTGFKLPNGADRSPDASWVTRARWEALSPEERRQFPPLCPDLVVELLSPSDSLPELQSKMREYMENGARLGWMLDPKTGRVEIYRPKQEVVVLSRPESLLGEDVLPGFVLDLRQII